MQSIKTKKELVDSFYAGEMVLVGEYRSSEAEQITWRDKASGAMLSAPMLRHVVELGVKSAIVSERVDRATFKPENYVPTFKKGDKVIVRLRTCMIEKGVIKLDGTLEPLPTV